MVTDKIVTQLDKDIKNIEKCSNKVLATKWVVYKDVFNSDQTCVHLSLTSASCWDMELGDSGIPSCEFCWLTSDIECWYEKMRRTVGNHRDPRIDGPGFGWTLLGMDLGRYLVKLKDRKLAQRVDWKKLAYLIRGFLMYAATVRLTEMLVKQLDAAHFEGTDLMQQLMDRYGGHRFEGFFDINFDSIIKEVNSLLDALIEMTDYRNIFDRMTTVERINFNRNDFDDWRHYGQDEFDEYIALHYRNHTDHVGTVFGRLISTRKNVVFNPLASPFIDQMIFDATTDAEFQRLAKLGVNVGQKVVLPTRRLRNENRLFLWNILEDWPPCAPTEGNEVNHTAARYRCTTPLPMITIDQSDITTSHNKIKIQVEMI